MAQKSPKHKFKSILLTTLLICPGLLSLIPLITNNSMGREVTTSTETPISDFVNGTLDNVSIIVNGSATELRLKLIELNEWTNNTPFISPHYRQYSVMATIWGTDKVVLFGGQKGSSQLFNDTWIFDFSDNKWIEMKLIIHPSARSCHAMASIYGTDKIILFGGTNNSIVFNDTWIYDLSNNTWENITTSNNPGKIYQHAMASVFGTNKVVLFGGSKSGTTNETWIFDISDKLWSIKSPVISPSDRSFHAMASIFGTDNVMIFAGFNQKNDTWIYDLSDNIWTKMAYGPIMRLHHAMASVYGTDKVLLFGGVNRTSWADLNDTWLYDFSEDTWTELKPIKNPYAMMAHGMSTIWGTDKVILFSGPRSDSILNWPNETWTFELNDYIENGTFISPPFKFGPNTSLKTLNWNNSVPNKTSIKFQLRTASTESELFTKKFIGYDGNSLTYYNKTNYTIWSGHDGDKWIQYKAYLSTKNPEETPRLKNVTITYNYWPNTTLIKPENESIINTNCPVFAWNFTDRDSSNQSTFHVIIDDDINFESVDYDSNEQSSSNRSWQFPNGTTYSGISDGIWYWKVKTKDSDGEWGLFSVPWKFRIDTIEPTSIIKTPVNGFYNKLNTISGISSDSLDGTGLKKVEIAINRLNDDSYWTGQKWTDSESWFITSGTTKWAYDTASVIWYSGFKYNIQSRAIDNATNIEVPKPGKVITMDFDNVTFSNAFPSFTDVSFTEDVEVGITISDQISGVNASTIEYKTSEDEGKTWSSWEPVLGLESGRSVNITLNLTFPNGTGNRIKWRASDIAGNGPKESITYSIKIDTSQFKPRVRLLSPKNNSILPTTSTELHWVLVTRDLTNVTFDVYLDTVNPPVEIKKSSIVNSFFMVDNLADGVTYFWSVVPRYGKYNGSCVSGVWSFTVDTSVPIPHVTLIYPIDGSIISSPKPTLVWTVEYNGMETLSYDVYLNTNKNFTDYERSTSTHHLPNTILKDNTTYYWKIIPWAGNIKGQDSETWSFTVKKDYVPKFGINLTIDPTEIELEPGGMTIVKAKVTNLGELIDIISLSVEIPPEADVGAMVNEPINLELSPEDNGSFNITVTATEDIKQNEVILTIIAVSEKAIEYGKTVEKREELTVKIIKKGEPGEEKSDSTENYWIYLIVIIIIILIIIILYLKQKKQPKQEPTSTEDAIIETTPLAAPEKPQEQFSPTPTVAQPPTTSTPENEEKAVTPSTSAPELPSPSTESLEVTQQQIPQVEPKPQLPPAQPQISTQESKDEIPTPTLVNSNETSEDSTRPNELNEDPSNLPN